MDYLTGRNLLLIAELWPLHIRAYTRADQADQARSADHAAVTFGDKGDRLQAASDDRQHNMTSCSCRECRDQLVRVRDCCLWRRAAEGLSRRDLSAL